MPETSTAAGPPGKSPSDAWLDVRLVGEQANRPPMRTLRFEVTLRNRAPRARWFLLPAILTATWSRPPGGVSSVEVWALTGTGAVVMGDFLGNGGFRALKLPAGATVTLRRFEVPLLEDDRPKAVSFEATAADAVAIAGRPIEEWFPSDPQSADGAAVEGGDRISARRNDGLAESPVTLTGAERRTITIALP